MSVYIYVKIDRSRKMYQEEIFSNAMTNAKRDENLPCEVKGMEAAIERFFTRLFETTSSVAERDFNALSL